MKPHIRTLAAAALVAGAFVGAQAPQAQAAEQRFSDGECDVTVYDWFTDNASSGHCAGVDLLWTEVANSKNGVSVTVKYRYDMPYHFTTDERQVVWLNTDNDPAPDLRVAAYRPGTKTISRISKVSGWADGGNAISCDDAFVKLAVYAEKFLVKLPKSCISKGSRIRVAARSFDRFDDGRSWRRDFLPRARTWTGAVQA